MSDQLGCDIYCGLDWVWGATPMSELGLV
jgi:hypothetical protein